MVTNTFAKKIKAFFQNRHVLFGIICVLVFGILAAQLTYLTVDQGEYYYAQSLEKERVELTLDGSRGRILDRNGIPLAVNNQIYVAQIDRQRMPSDETELNRVLERTLSIIVEQGDAKCLADNIPIKWDEDTNTLYYVWRDSDEDTQAARLKRWYGDIGADEKVITLQESADPAKMLSYLRERYNIRNADDPETGEVEKGISDTMAIMMISIRLDLYLKRYSQYQPIRIASGIGEKTVAQLSTYSAEMPGIDISVEEGRYYPMGDTAAHIIGYVTKITDSDDPDALTEQGYDVSSDKIGQKGVEEFAEEWLTGCTSDKQGKLVAEVDSNGKVVRTLEKVEPTNGDDVYLTIDSRLQMAVEDILEEELVKMRMGVTPYDEAPLVNNGAAVVLDIHTGEILAMASYPSFDLNLFPNGISNDDYHALQAQPGNPEFATAFQGHMIPGSVIKPAIAVAALEEGVISKTDKVYDHLHYYYDSATSISCWSNISHGWETVQDAIRNSCNYFFVEMGMRLGIDRINTWTDAFGLSSPTGLEIVDSDFNAFGSPALKERLFKKSDTMGPEIRLVLGRAGYDEVGADLIDALVAIEIGEDSAENLQKIRSTLQQYGYFVFKDQNADGLDDVTGRTRNATDQNFANAGGAIRYTLSNFQNWTPVDTGQTAYGQGYTMESPLNIARYLAALANGGHVLDTRVVKQAVTQGGTVVYDSQVEDDMTKRVDSYYDEDGKPINTVSTDLPEVGADPDILDYVKEGMHRVVYDGNYAPTRGTAYQYFFDMDPSITLAGKTGTAQTVVGNLDKNNAWFMCFSPYENPNIAVVVAVPNGRTSGNAAPIARKILEQYYAIQREDQGDALPSLNSVAP